jgi:hypothetical protein
MPTTEWNIISNCVFPHPSDLCVINSLAARFAYCLVFVDDNIAFLPAENASRFILGKDDASIFYIDFERIFDVDAEMIAQLLRNNYATQLIDPADYARGFQIPWPPFPLDIVPTLYFLLAKNVNHTICANLCQELTIW